MRTLTLLAQAGLDVARRPAPSVRQNARQFVTVAAALGATVACSAFSLLPNVNDVMTAWAEAISDSATSLLRGAFSGQLGTISQQEWNIATAMTDSPPPERPQRRPHRAGSVTQVDGLRREARRPLCGRPRFDEGGPSFVHGAQYRTRRSSPGL